MKPIAWYDPTNGMVSTDKDSPLFTPLGQVWGLYLKEEWVGLTGEGFSAIKFPAEMRFPAEFRAGARWAEAKLKEKNFD